MMRDKLFYLTSIERANDLPFIGKLYFDIAEEIYPGDNEFHEDSIKYIGLRDNYYEAVSNFIIDLARNIKHVNDLRRAQIYEYEISAIIDHITNPINRHLHNEVFKVKEAFELILDLKNVKTKSELIHIKPLLFFESDFNYPKKNLPNFLKLPPFTLGNRTTINGVF